MKNAYTNVELVATIITKLMARGSNVKIIGKLVRRIILALIYRLVTRYVPLNLVSSVRIEALSKYLKVLFQSGLKRRINGLHFLEIVVYT